MAHTYRHYSWRSLVLLFHILQIFCIKNTNECDQTFVSRPNGPQNGTFKAPNLPNPDGHSRQCIYLFVAGPKQRVEIVFSHFSLRGTPPDGSAMGVLPAISIKFPDSGLLNPGMHSDSKLIQASTGDWNLHPYNNVAFNLHSCVHEYMDVYSEVQNPDPTELINSPFGGRYCGHIPPRRRISLYSTIALGFYTDKNNTTPALFGGTYTFINDSEYEIGAPVGNSPCNFVVHATKKRTGVLLSPTYPGSYPKDLSCSYQFLGQPNQRVRVEFRDFDLFFGGPHCPFDYVKVYDGLDNESAIIGTYCGQQRNLVLYSSDNYMLVSFVTIQRTANTQNRGFKGIFEFSESFVKLDFIKDGGEHIRGSECDQKILSKKASSGHVYSPNYPFPYIPKIVCRYFIYGMQDSQHLERVKIEFFKFEIPKGEKGDCSDGYLKLYLKGQEATDSYDKFDHEMCGAESNPSVMTSDGPRLVMVFSSGELQGGGFKAKYSFETEYKIPGTAAPDGSCSFTYSSISRKKGEFNSPRYPSNYPSDTNCTYLFVATPNEQVTIVFDHFKVRADGANSTSGSYGTDNCVEDWLEIYQVYRFNEKLIGRYCGMTAPGPVESNRGATGIKIVLHTDSEGVYSGFKARYTFETAKSIFGDCGSNVSNTEYGVISSPNFPLNYEGPGRGLASKTCNWFIGVKPKHKIVLYFDVFAVEGEPSARGCPAAVVRVWSSNDGLPLELCGEKSPDDRWEYMSESNTMRISFISADKSAGAQGFRAVWTEVTKDTECSEFVCSGSSLCIAEKLRCNRVANCGARDSSDELNCVVEAPMDAFLFLGVTICVCSVAFLALCFWCHRKRRRSRRLRRLSRLRRVPDMSSRLGSMRSLSPANPPESFRQVCDDPGERFAIVDSV